MSIITYGILKTQNFKKQWKKCKNRKPLYVQGSKGYSFWDKNWKLISFWVELHSVSWKHKKINFFMMFFWAKNDERENCQQGKVLSSSPIRIGQFQKMSPPKDPKKCVKSVTKWKALSQLTYRIFIKFLKNIKKNSDLCAVPHIQTTIVFSVSCFFFILFLFIY